MRVLVVNDFVRKGGAEEVYRLSVDVLRARNDVEVETFDERTLIDVENCRRARAWSPAAARALDTLLERFRPQRILVHNYHNLLSSAILPVLGRYKRRSKCRLYMTAHDYHLVFYNPSLMVYRGGRAQPLSLDQLRRGRRIVLTASPRGFLHDVAKKLHWHAVNALFDPLGLFDEILCPSPFMRDLIARFGRTPATLLPNPIDTTLVPRTPKPARKGRLDLAFVGRLEADKGLAQFLALMGESPSDAIASLTVYGDGPERDSLEQHHAALVEAGRLRFAGRLDHATLFAMLPTHDAIVLPSIWVENAPLVIVEAAMLGLPALVHDIGSLSTFGDDLGNKIRYRNTADDLARALVELRAHLDDEQRRYDWSRYSVDRYAASLYAALGIGGNVSRTRAH
ncbi:glycosyltransferase family 4 protein [Burkholderia cenocepacia]|uniref:glycosyltransferase family 4 protein n=1 Tax=Burkholderia cenocepacia TaxID=95486 RepID=UPI000980FD90|nr:glycosyltransferase family 4 protein [Burkholderia cenocepacia]AQQ24553.1 glycosyl transferase [Burkholderia cenocepacia]ONV82392.1 glycosyl transferase [Burkholderia cenocepacia]ONW06625.1 glycosyl transferase [Burkholderia cenocepacia]ONW11524.1 glycosyl transferase [Burkholderia cenocepacia]ONW41774.1 glycosyl transferase [Burkholderia cenocepacia]